MRSIVAAVLCLLSALPAAAQETELARLRAASRASSRDAAVQTEYGVALLRAGRWREAKAQLQRAARLQRGSAEAMYLVATVSFEQGDNRAARSACRALESTGRDAPLTRVCRARAALAWNRSALAFEELQAAIQADANHVEALIALGDAHRLRAAIAEAETNYRRAIELAPTRAEPHLGLGRLYFAAGRRDDAVASLRAAIALDPNHPVIQYELGRILAGDEARQLLERAAAGRPTWAEVQVALGDAKLAANDAAGAQAAYEAALRLDRRAAAAHTGLARVHMAAQRWAEAEAALRASMQIVPNSKQTALALADVFAATDRYEEALEQYRQAADLDPRDPAALLAATALAIRLRRDVLAAGFLDRLLEANPNLGAALVLYGDIMKARGDRAGAIRYYQRAMSGTGQFDRARVQTELRALGVTGGGSAGTTRPRPRGGRR